MKNLLALMLALAMVFAVAACGSQSGEKQTSAPAPAEDTTVETPAELDDESAADAGEPEEDPVVQIDPLTFECNTTFYETDTAGVVMQYFSEELEELSDGAITCNIAWGGTLYDDTSAFDAVRSGAIQMIAMKETRILDFMPLIGIPSCAPASDGYGALDYMNTIFFEDPETSQMIAEMCSEQGVKFLDVITTGENAFSANFPWSTIDELVEGCSSFGAMATAKYDALGLNCAAYAGPDVYDAISRGIIDAANYTVYGSYSMSWYEVAPYMVRDTLWAVGNTLTVNENWWNGLTAAQQEIIQQAADMASEYSAEYVSGLMDDVCAEISAASGVQVLTLNDADSQRWWAATFNATADDSMKRVVGGEYEKSMITVLERAAEITGIEWNYEG